VIVRLVFFLLVGFLTADRLPADPPAPGGLGYAILVGGLGGQAPYGAWYADWLARFQSYLVNKAHLPPDHIVLLSGQGATLDAITAAFHQLAKSAQPKDQLILFIVGHGEISGPTPKLTLKGPDPSPLQIAALLDSFPAKNQVILNFSASSGDFLKALSAPNRVNLTATSPTEIEEPVFPEFFLRGLESGRADADKNGTVTLLEAYNWAAQQTAWWIARWDETDSGKMTDPDKPAPPTIWKASGKETIEIFEKLYAGVPYRKLDPSSDRNAPDAPVALVPPGGQVTLDWQNRRVVDEHALLEDSGQGIGVSVITDTGLQPILGLNPGDPGYLAAHTVLGIPAAPPSP
jgi:hypothetical protein